MERLRWAVEARAGEESEDSLGQRLMQERPTQQRRAVPVPRRCGGGEGRAALGPRLAEAQSRHICEFMPMSMIWILPVKFHRTCAIRRMAIAHRAS
jgi:hypothetical protein